MSQPLVPGIKRVARQGLVGLADYRDAENAAEPGNYPRSRPDLDALRLFHLDIGHDGTDTGTKADNQDENRIRRHQRTAKYQCAKNYECDMVPGDHEGMLR
jgi:hypothetical protein